MYKNVATEISPDRDGQTEMSRDHNGPDRNGLTEMARPNRPDRIGQTEKSRTRQRYVSHLSNVTPRYWTRSRRAEFCC